MNSSKVTNALLIALVAINGLFFIGWIMSSAHHRHNRCFAMRGQFSERRHGEFASRYHHFGGFHSHNRDFKRHDDSRWN